MSECSLETPAPAAASTPIVCLPPPQPCQLHVVKPNNLDGKNYRLFRCQCAMYMMANRDCFTTSEKKILFILSYMKGGPAGQWAKTSMKRYWRMVIWLPHLENLK